jgi:hypothetical protein
MTPSKQNASCIVIHAAEIWRLENKNMTQQKDNSDKETTFEKQFIQLWNAMYQSERAMLEYCNNGSIEDLESFISEIQRGEHKEDFAESDSSAALSYLVTAVQFKKGTFNSALIKTQIHQEFDAKVGEAIKIVDGMVKDLKNQRVIKDDTPSKDYVA